MKPDDRLLWKMMKKMAVRPVSKDGKSVSIIPAGKGLALREV